MAITRVNFASTAAGGDSPTAALVKLDNNDADLQGQVTAAQNTANAALPKAGGTISGNLGVLGGLNVSGVVNMYNLFNVSGASTFGNGVRVNGTPPATSQGGCLGWNTVSPGSGGMDIQNNLGGGSGGFFFSTINNNATAVLGTFSFSATGGWGSNTNSRFAPTVDASQGLGASSLRWTAVYSVNGTIQTSDANAKTDITDSALGLDFVLALRPVSYRMKVARNEVTTVPNPAARVETVVVGYKVDAEGNPELDATGQPIPITQEIHYDTTMDVVTPVAGTREHQGLIAQEVCAALRAADVDPAKCGIWTIDDPSDPTSAQGLRYEELIGPIIGAIKQLHDLVHAQAATIAALTARVDALGQPASGSADSAGQGGTAS